MFKKIVVDCADDQAGKDAVMLAAKLAALHDSDWTVVELDILLLGSRPHRPLRHLLTGGVSARVMREAHCPVVALRRGVCGESTLMLAHETVAPGLGQ